LPQISRLSSTFSLEACLAVITVSFLPVFTLEDQEGRMFRPLAFTKTFAMAGGALLSVTLVPMLMMLFIRGRIIPEHRNPVNRILIWLYRPLIAGVLRARAFVIALALLILAATAWPAKHLGSEFKPTLNEGMLMYMPVALRGCPSPNRRNCARLLRHILPCPTGLSRRGRAPA
jgi:Cu(I)/Ag(I) efflux system membrane protein CusA/SilA